MPAITLKSTTMQDMLYDEELIVSDRVVDNDRWTILHEIVFKHKGKLYMTHYRVGATEYQYEQPFEYDDLVKCQEVEECLVPGYRNVPEPFRRKI